MTERVLTAEWAPRRVIRLPREELKSDTTSPSFARQSPTAVKHIRGAAAQNLCKTRKKKIAPTGELGPPIRPRRRENGLRLKAIGCGRGSKSEEVKAAWPNWANIRQVEKVSVVEGLPAKRPHTSQSDAKEGEEVQRGFLTILGGQQRPTIKRQRRDPSQTGSRRRISYGRVMVNRIWQYHFGKGDCRGAHDSACAVFADTPGAARLP